MGLLKEQTFLCPVCQCEFRAQVATPGVGVQAKRTDFHERMHGFSVLPHLVASCPACGYTAWPNWFQDALEGGVDARVRDFVLDGIKPCIALEPLHAPATRFEVAARIAYHQERERDHVADLWLHAAWCAVEAEDHEAERYYRLKAVALYESVLAEFNAVDRTRRGLLTYLVGELWRRIGDERRAALWFALVEHEVSPANEEQWLVQLAHQQLTAPKEWLG